MLFVLGTTAWVGYWCIPDRLRWYWIAALSAIAILYFAPMALVVLSVLLLLTYFGRSVPNVVIPILIVHLLIWKIWVEHSLLGLSFVTFFLIHYVVTVSEKLPPHSLLEFSGRVFLYRY